MEDTFAVVSTPLTASFAHVCPAQPGKPCSRMCLFPMRISWKEYFFVVAGYCGLLLCWGLLWLLTVVLAPGDIALILIWVSRSTSSPSQEHPSKKSPMHFATQNAAGFTRFPGQSSNLFSCFGKNGSGGNTVALR